MKQKTVSQLMRIVSNAYDADGIVWHYYRDSDGDHGDTLAKFVDLGELK